MACSHPDFSTYSTAAPLFLKYPKKWQVFQQDADQRGTIVIDGIYDEAFTGGIVPTAIEARWGETAEWTVVDPSPDLVDRSFRGELANQPAFAGRRNVELRFANAPQISIVVEKVGVGIQVIGEGQSNMVQIFDEAAFTAEESSTAWLLTDPMDPNSIRPANDPLNGCYPPLLGGGSMNPELMDRISLANGGVPVMYIGAAIAGAKIEEFQPGNPIVWAAIVRNVHGATAGQNCPALRIRLQGEAETARLTTEEYESLYLSWEDAFQAEMGCPEPIPVVLGVIGAMEDTGTGYTFEEVEPIRQALRELPGMRPQIRPGPETMLCPMTNFIHFNTDAKQCLMDAFCASIDATGVVACD